MNKKRNSLITAGTVVLVISLLPAISSALLYDRGTIDITQLTFKGANFDPEWSSDGSKIVYVSTERGSQAIWVMDSDGSNKKMISDPGYGCVCFNPIWNPDGTRIAFGSCASKEDKGFIHLDGCYIYIMDPDGSNKMKLSSSISSTAHNLEWSPDGSKITYDGTYGSTFYIYAIDIDSGDITKLITTDNHEQATWSPDGSKIAFVKHISPTLDKGEIWIMDSDGSNKDRVDSFYYTLLEPYLACLEEHRHHIYRVAVCREQAQAYPELFPRLSWNPDGTKIAFVTEYWDIAVVDLSDSSVEILTEKRPEFWSGTDIVKEKVVTGEENYPVWSPDGSRILFRTEEGGLWIMNPDGRDKKQLTFIEYDGEVVLNPKWSPDGSKILFERKYLGSWDIFVMTLSEAIIPATTPSPVATINISVTPTPIQLTPTPATPSPALTPIHSPTPTPRLTPAPTVTPTEFPTPEEKGIPGFEAVSAIVGLLAVAYLFRRRR